MSETKEPKCCDIVESYTEQWAHVTFVDFGLWLETWRETRGVRIEWAAGFKTELFQFAHHSAVNPDLHVSWKGVKWSHAHASMHVHNSQNIFQNTFSSFNSQLPGARCKFLFVMSSLKLQIRPRRLPSKSVTGDWNDEGILPFPDDHTLSSKWSKKCIYWVPSKASVDLVSILMHFWGGVQQSALTSGEFIRRR